jgi:hypothetical protein
VSVSADGKTTTVPPDTVDGDPIRFADAVVWRDDRGDRGDRIGDRLIVTNLQAGTLGWIA